ncbi:hypothetical protein [Salipaludibacillus daqingensis]|uniref:hypothetical protein n=1 Tax=Salipaludibacillus daqingensis TaxID=3041001 RepID=UPI002473EE1D|nr:hypothetical protein [Salipaludibacillus daqingensis]
MQLKPIPYPIFFGLAIAFSASAMNIVLGQLLFETFPLFLGVVSFVTTFIAVQFLNMYLKRKQN